MLMDMMGETHDPSALFAAMALLSVLDGDLEVAEAWAIRIPRTERGRMKIACDDLDMLLSRLGRKGTDG